MLSIESADTSGHLCCAIDDEDAAKVVVVGGDIDLNVLRQSAAPNRLSQFPLLLRLLLSALVGLVYSIILMFTLVTKCSFALRFITA